jgi:hypothetical protein
MTKQEFTGIKKQQQSIDLGKGNYTLKSKKPASTKEHTIKKSARITRAPK